MQQCFEKAEEQIDDSQLKERKMSRDEWTHGSLLIINELLRCSNAEGEVCAGSKVFNYKFFTLALVKYTSNIHKQITLVLLIVM